MVASWRVRLIDEKGERRMFAPSPSRQCLATYQYRRELVGVPVLVGMAVCDHV